MPKSLLSYLCGYITVLSSVSAFSATVGIPTQCDPLTVSWTGGQAPFEILLAPFNQTLLNSSVPTSAFSNGVGSYSIPQLPYVTGSQFVLTMSDATGFGSGGTTTVLTVGAPIAHNNCNTTSSQNFYFSTSDTIQQCSQYTFSYYNGAVLPATITGLIPGGNSVIIYPVITSSYEWLVDIQEGTDIVFYMTDSRPGVGEGGVDILKKVANSTDASCLNVNSPSSTSSAPSQTSSQSTSSQTSSQGNNTSTVGIIAGAAAGGVVLLILLIILGVYCVRKTSRSSATTSTSQREARRLERTGNDREVIEDDQAVEKFTHQADRISRPLLTTPGSQQNLRHISFTDSFAGSSSTSSASRRMTAIDDQIVLPKTLPHQTLPFGLAAPVHPGTHSHLTNASVGDFATNDPQASFRQMQSSRQSSNTGLSTMYGDARNSSVYSANGHMPTIPHHMSASSFTISNSPSPLDLTQASRLSSNINGSTTRGNLSAGQASSLNNPLKYQVAPAHFAPTNQPGTLSQYPAAGHFPVGDGTSRIGSNMGDFSSDIGAGGSSMLSSGRAAGPTVTNSSAQIIRHSDMADVRTLADVQEVIELPPEYTERTFSAEAAREVVGESAPTSNQKF